MKKHVVALALMFALMPMICAGESDLSGKNDRKWATHQAGALKDILSPKTYNGKQMYIQFSDDYSRFLTSCSLRLAFVHSVSHQSFRFSVTGGSMEVADGGLNIGASGREMCAPCVVGCRAPRSCECHPKYCD